MNRRRLARIAQSLFAVGVLAGIVLIYRRWLHVNPTTVALTLLLFVLVVAARLRLLYAIAISIIAAACYNFYFLPPLGTFTISDPQNLLALIAFIATSIIGSRLSGKAREEADQARARQRELELLFALSRDLLQTDKVAALAQTLPGLICTSAGAHDSTLYLLEGDCSYSIGCSPSGPQLSLFRQLSTNLTSPEPFGEDGFTIPLRAGALPRGLLQLTGVSLSADTLQAIGGLVSIALDRAQALEEVARAEAHQESERLRTLILDSITHDLRTPLTSIKGATGTLLSTESVSSEDQHELLTIIEEETDRLNRLIGQALETAQIETHEVHMAFAPTDLQNVIDEARDNCSWIAATHRLSVAIPRLPLVLADRAMIAKVISNLLGNAAKYSPAGSAISISAELHRSEVVVSVEDRGAGIDPAEQSLIFERLYRSRTHSEHTNGTGMGLAISRAIVESHGGRLTVISDPDSGSVFSFTLPLAVVGGSELR